MALSAIHSFVALSTREKRLFLEVWLRLGLFRMAIALLPFARLTRSLNAHAESDSGPLSPQHHDTALLIRTAIKRAANHTPWESACLVQALCAQRMLKKRNISGSLHLGVMQEGKESDSFKAHAWIQCQDLIICGAFKAGEFREISVQSWTGQ
jgi:hypothetical protein